MKATSYQHVVTDDDGVPYVKGTTMKVCELAAEQIAYGWSSDEMKQHHPYLSFGQIHSALAYFADHEEAIRRDLERRRERVEALRQELPGPPKELMRRLRAAKARREEAPAETR